MRATRSHFIISVLAAVGAGFAVSAMIGAPPAVAQECEPGQVVIEGFCNDNVNNAPAPQEGTGGQPGMGGGGPVMGGGDVGGGGDRGYR